MKKLIFIFVLCVSFAHSMDIPNQQSEITYSLPVKETDRDAYVIDAFDKNLSIGYIDFGPDQLNQNFGTVNDMSVNQRYRKKGIGYKLFKKAIAELTKKNYRTIVWTAVPLEDTTLEELEKIYTSFIEKLQKEMVFNFSMEPRQKSGPRYIRSMKISFSN